jgi:beta-phosphoglucomutase-like phosphatase (HAD superfamily)
LLAIGESAKPPKEGGGAYFGDGTGVSSGLFGGFYPIAFDDGSGNAGMLYQGDSGFSLITYSDGRSVVVKDTVLETPTDEPPPNTLWVNLADIVSVPPKVAEEILAEVPVVKEKTSEEKEALKAKLNEPPPATIADAKETIAKDTSEALDAAYQTPEEVTAALKAAGYNPTPEEAASMRGEKSAEQLVQEAKAYATPRTVTANEAKQFLEELGYNPTDEEVAQFVGQANDEAYKEQQKAASAEYAAPRMVTEAEARKALTDAGYNPTDEEVAQFVGQSNDIAYREQQIAAAGTYAAPRVVTFAEAKQALTDAGYNPTDEEVAQFVGQANDANYQEQQIAASGAYAAPRVVTFDEAKKALTDAGYNPTDEEVAQFVGQANDANYQANQQTAAGEYADPRVVDEGEAKAAYAALGLKKPTADDIKALMGQYEETGLTEKAKANLDNARYNSIMAQLDDLTVGASQETLDTIELVKADLTKQVTNLGFKIDKTAEDLTGAIGDVKTNVLAKIAENEAAGLTRDEATQKAIADVAADLGTTTSAISAQIGTPASVDAEGNPVAATGIYAGLADISTDLKESEARVTSDVRAVADLVGKPASEVTQGDIDYVKQFLSGGGGGQADLTYDYNGDGVVDINDQTALEGIVGGAGEGSPFAPAAGSKWAATGIYGTLDANSAAAQKAIAEEAERTRAANARLASANRNAAAQQAQRTQRMGNLNTMMGMLGQANDIGGQQVTVKPSDPAKIGYMYDFGSIFANPTQEKMFASPYGNYAEGGMVEDDVNAELIKMLRS